MFRWQYLIPLLLITVQIYRAQECEKFTKLNLSHAFIGTKLNVRLLLYTRENRTCGTLMSHTDLSASPLLNLSRPSTFVIHGFRPTGSPPVWLDNITEALLAWKDINVIVVDWNRGSATSYFKAVENTKKAADNITAFIHKMQEHGASLSSMHLIGFSLGAHMSGFIGANLNGLIGRITGLDPAGVMFTDTSPEDRLDSTDAQFVDVLHTDMDALGFRKTLGHIDFYANGGSDQPGCPKTVFSGGAYFKCDHQRSVSLYLESLVSNCSIRAYPCSSYEDFLNGNCTNCDQFGAAGCPVFGHDAIRWKDMLLSLGETKTFFTTNANSPFCRTNYRVEVMTWNKNIRWGYITAKLHYKNTEAVATIEHTASMFKKYKQTTLLAQFDKDVPAVEKVSLKFSNSNMLKPKHKLRILRIRLTPLERHERSLCRYDVLLEGNKEVTFRPFPCEESSF
ncbi:lipase member H [Anabas testudineus]|uniref:Lipase domain-containing protein n=1 Tax=Anabas testudineus TaxID=64144 RepID=A0A3Q1K679_ANATE|nr:lipase member H [Anabas testudineus]